MDYAALRTELLTDPLGLGYAAQTDAQAATTIDTHQVSVARTNVPPNDVLGAIQPADLNALTTNQLLQLQLLLLAAGAGGVDASNTNIRGDFSNIFAGKTTTLNALNALGTMTESRAAQLGLGTVTTLDVTTARSGVW